MSNSSNLITKQIRNLEWYFWSDDAAFEDVLQGWYEKYQSFFESKIPTKNIAVQAGGYCGIFPRMLSQIFSTVYTFEPDVYNFFCLTLNCINHPNVIKTQGALGFDQKMITVKHNHPRNRGMHSVFCSDDSKIPVYRIDDYNLSDCNLIQLDTEGFEYNILRGAVNTISRYKPIISVEDTNKDIELMLSEFNYKAVHTIYRDTIYQSI